MEPGGFVTVTTGVGGAADAAGTAGAGVEAADGVALGMGDAGDEEGLRRAFPQAIGVDDVDTFSASWYGSLNACFLLYSGSHPTKCAVNIDGSSPAAILTIEASLDRPSSASSMNFFATSKDLVFSSSVEREPTHT